MGKEAMLLSGAIHLKKKPMKKRITSNKNKNKHVFKKVLDYLMSDTFMFAPMYASHISSAVEPLPSVSTGVEENQTIEKGNDKKLVGKIGDYLKSDTYLYAPLVVPQPWDVDAASVNVANKETVARLEELDKKRSADVLNVEAGKADESGRKMVDAVSKDQNMDGIPHTRSTMVTRTRVRRETVKHMVYQNC